MEIVSFLSTLKKALSFALIGFVLAGCQNLAVKSRLEEKKDPAPVVTYGNEESVPEEVVSDAVGVPSYETSDVPKFGIILGSAGARSFLYTGFLKEFVNRKAPIHAISGIEWGALVAGLYAMKGSANDVEWQLSKIKEEMVLKKSLIPGRSEVGNVSQLAPFLKDFFAQKDVKNFVIPFSCPAIRFKTEQSFVMARGQAAQAISYCLPSPGIFTTYQGYGASQYDFSKAAEFLRSQGANYIILVTAISDRTAKLGTSSESWESNHWHHLAYKQSQKIPGIDAVIPISAKGFSVLDFKKGRELIRESHDSGSKAAKQFLEQWKL